MNMRDQKFNVLGHVKWFDVRKGFGFVVPDGGGKDILLHGNVLRDFGQSSVAEGTAIELTVQLTERGCQAIEVLNLTPPTQLDDFSLSEIVGLSSKDLQVLPWVPARVKWFDGDRGYGFINSFAEPSDIFVHSAILNLSGFANLEAGEAICARVINGERGRMAAGIAHWDLAVE